VPHGDDFEEVARAEEALSRYRDALDEAQAMVPALEAQLSCLPTTAPDASLGLIRPIHEGPFGVNIGSPARRRIPTLAPHAPETAGEGGVVRARFEHQGDPFALACAIDSDEFEVVHAVATSVPLGAPELHVRPETWGDGLAKALRLRRDAVTGDDA